MCLEARATPEPRSGNSETTGRQFRNPGKDPLRSFVARVAWCYRNHDRKRGLPFHGAEQRQARSARIGGLLGGGIGGRAGGGGSRRPCARPASYGRTSSSATFLGAIAQGRHGHHGASCSSRWRRGPTGASCAISPRGGRDRGHALGEGARRPIHDKDVLIFCISQLMAAVNAGRPTSPVLQLKAHDLLVATNRETSGDGYRRLREALERLVGDADRHQHRDGRRREHPRLRADRRLGDPAPRPRRPDDPRHRHALGLDLSLGDLEIGADAAPRLLRARASRWSGGSTRSPASIAAARPSGAWGSTRC